MQNYSKKNWKSLNEEIPSVKLGKQIKENKELEYNIDTKYITGYDETELIDNPGKKYFKNIEFQGKKFMKYTKTKDIIKYNRVYYYCKNHRTSKLSDQLDNKGNKKRINLCNAKIKYDIIKNLYSFFGQHSEECESTFKSEILNKAEIDVEINNYEEFRESLKNYLKNYPIVTFSEFKKYGQELYYKKENNFSINNNMYSNIYYNWRKSSNLFKKSSIFDNQKTLDGNQFMRDYCITMLYKKNNKDVFQHEHIIFVSDYFIKKLYKSEHFYIDGTFIYPSDFKQMIVILYFDNEKRKRFPGLFALMNNKKEEGYFYLFTRIKNILTIESSKELSLKSYSVDFEIGLINSLKRVFPNVKIIGCFFIIPEL